MSLCSLYCRTISERGLEMRRARRVLAIGKGPEIAPLPQIIENAISTPSDVHRQTVKQHMLLRHILHCAEGRTEIRASCAISMRHKVKDNGLILVNLPERDPAYITMADAFPIC
jgi:hypothetical protein